MLPFSKLAIILISAGLLLTSLIAAITMYGVRKYREGHNACAMQMVRESEDYESHLEARHQDAMSEKKDHKLDALELEERLQNMEYADDAATDSTIEQSVCPSVGDDIRQLLDDAARPKNP